MFSKLKGLLFLFVIACLILPGQMQAADVSVSPYWIRYEDPSDFVPGETLVVFETLPTWYTLRPDFISNPDFSYQTIYLNDSTFYSLELSVKVEGLAVMAERLLPIGELSPVVIELYSGCEPGDNLIMTDYSHIKEYRDPVFRKRIHDLERDAVSLTIPKQYLQRDEWYCIKIKWYKYPSFNPNRLSYKMILEKVCSFSIYTGER